VLGVDEVQLIGAEVLGAEVLGRSAEVAGKAGDAGSVGFERSGRVATEAKVVEITLAQRGHGGLVAERKGAGVLKGKMPHERP
jgi:hypothetical protein